MNDCFEVVGWMKAERGSSLADEEVTREEEEEPKRPPRYSLSLLTKEREKIAWHHHVIITVYKSPLCHPVLPRYITAITVAE